MHVDVKVRNESLPQGGHLGEGKVEGKFWATILSYKPCENLIPRSMTEKEDGHRKKLKTLPIWRIWVFKIVFSNRFTYFKIFFIQAIMICIYLYEKSAYM